MQKVYFPKLIAFAYFHVYRLTDWLTDLLTYSHALLAAKVSLMTMSAVSVAHMQF